MRYKGIGIWAPRYSGKTWIANWFNLHLDKAYRIALADALKLQFAQHIGIAVELLYKNPEKEQYRPDLIRFADEVKQTNKYLFCDTFLEETAKRPDLLWICDDVRRKIELGALVGAGGIVVEIIVPLEERIRRGYVPSADVDNHPTECELVGHPYFDEPGHRIIWKSNESMPETLQQWWNSLIII